MKEDFIIEIVADYGGKTGSNDLAFSEVKNRVYKYFDKNDLNIKDINTISTNSFNTIETGFMVAQMARGTTFPKRHHVIYHNCAPRKDDIAARKDNAGEFLAASLLDDGTLIIGPYSGYSFSFIKDFAKVYKVNCDNKGSQFRSRDVFPKYVAGVAKWVHENQNKEYRKDLLKDCPLVGEEIIDVPDINGNRIVYIDGYGNIKTTINIGEDCLQKKKLHISIKGLTTIAHCGEGIFSVPDGEFVIAPGSSGWPLEDGTQRVFTEISLRGGSAARHFDYPRPGKMINISNQGDIKSFEE